MSTCIYCGEAEETRDHVPPKCLLDKPFPSNMLTVPACRKCNERFSLDEQYVMYLSDYLLSIHEHEGDFALLKAEKTFYHQEQFESSLEDRIMSSIKLDENGLPYFDFELDRVKNIASKIATGITYADESIIVPQSSFSTEACLVHWMDASTRDLASSFLTKTIQRDRFSYGVARNGKTLEVSMLICNSIFACSKAELQ